MWWKDKKIIFIEDFPFKTYLGFEIIQKCVTQKKNKTWYFFKSSVYFKSQNWEFEDQKG